MTPLHSASDSGNVQLVEVLVRAKADLEIKNDVSCDN